MADYQEVANKLFEAMDIITSKRISNLSYDKTLICTIENVENAKNGAYKVTDGVSHFIAYTDNSNKYPKGTKVYVEGTVVRKVGISSAYIEQVNEGYVTYDEDGNEVVVEGDGLTYGIYLYGGYNEVTKFIEGNVIYTNANVSYHYGSIQLVGVSNSTVDLLEDEKQEVSAVQLDGSMWTEANKQLYKYRLVEFKNLRVTGGKDDEDSDSYDIYTVTEDGVVVNLRVDQNTTIRINNKKNKTWTAFEGKTFESVVGIVATFQPYSGAQVIYQILITQGSDISYN